VLSERVLTHEKAVALFDKRRDAWLREDVAAYLDCFAEDMTFQSPTDREPLRGRAAFAALIHRSHAAVRPLAFDFKHIAVHGEFVLAEWRIAIERRDTGRRIEYDGMSVCEIRGDQIGMWREYWDPADLR
jgi:ketosteroid isomerase-like protein